MKKLSIFFSFLLIFTFFFVGSSYAANTFPPVPSDYLEERVPLGEYEYVIYKNFNGDIKMYVVNHEDSRDLGLFKFYKYDNTMITLSSTGVFRWQWALFTLVDGAWVWDMSQSATGPSSATTNFSMTEQFELYYSSLNIYESKSSQEIFFQQTPIPTNLTVEMMVAEEVPKMAERITQVMKIILLCGVGCLALLISLPLFGRVFRIFQVK